MAESRRPLADAVLPLIRTRADLHRWSTANAHGSEMHRAIDVLEAARPTTPPAEFYAVVHAALASADGDVDYFELDPVAYAPALGDRRRPRLQAGVRQGATA